MVTPTLSRNISTSSHIFPSAPPNARIHRIPENVDFISYSVQDTLAISAWFPNGAFTVNQSPGRNSDNFFEMYCTNCPRYSSYYLNDYLDDNGEVDEDLVPNHCYVFEAGYTGQSCPEGHVDEPSPVSFSVANIVFRVFLNIKNPEHPRLEYHSTSVGLKAGMLTEGGNILSTEGLAVANVHGTFGNICWGYNTVPKELNEIAHQFMSSRFNNDLTSISAFAENCAEMTELIETSRNFSRDNNFSSDKLLTRGGYSALLMVDAERDIGVFFTMLMAGFNPLPELPYLMVIPLQRTVFDANGHTYRGYKTDSDAVGKEWFITIDGKVVGQL